MKEWKEYSIGEICETISDTYKNNATNVVLINTSDVLEGKCLNHTFVANKDLRGQFKKQFRRNDILYSEIRPANKRYAFIDFEAEDYIASTKLMVIRPNEKVLPKYLYYILQSKRMIETLQTLAESRSGTFPQITFSELAIQQILLPPIKEQNSIVSFLESIDSKIELNRRINDNLEQQAQALFKAWFVDFEPFGGVMPENWHMGVLTEIADINPFRSIGKSEKVRYIDMAALNTNSSIPSSWSFRQYSGGMKFTNGDTLLARLTPCLENGKTAFINFLDEGEVAFGSTEYIVISPKKDYPAEIFYCLTRNNLFRDYAVAHMNGTSGRQRVSGKDIGNYIMPVAPLATLAPISKSLKSIFNTIRELEKQVRNLTSLRDTLLPMLMSGELKINNLNC